MLFTDGDLEMFDLGDPEQPVLLGAYRRKRDLSRWSGLHVAGDRVVLFGPDGIEVLALREGRFVPELALDRGVVGTIVAVESLGREIVAAGSRGIVLIDAEKGQREVLLERPVQGLARSGDRLLFTDGTSLFVSTKALLRERRVEAELRLGRGFGPGPLHVDDGPADRHRAAWRGGRRRLRARSAAPAIAHRHERGGRDPRRRADRRPSVPAG